MLMQDKYFVLNTSEKEGVVYPTIVGPFEDLESEEAKKVIDRLESIGWNTMESYGGYFAVNAISPDSAEIPGDFLKTWEEWDDDDEEML